MEYIPQTFEAISIAGAFAMFIWFVLRPLTKWFIARKHGTSVDIEERLHKVENDQYHYITGELEDLKKGQEYLRQEFGKIRERMAVVETKVNRNNG